MAPRSTKKRPTYRTYYGDSIKTIYRKFIVPAITKLLLHSEERSLDEGIRRFFHEDTRHIWFAVVLIPFEIPGKEWIKQNPSHLGYGESPRKVVPGDDIIVRIDDVEEQVDIEFNECVFSMHLEQYKYLQPKIALIG